MNWTRKDCRFQQILLQRIKIIVRSKNADRKCTNHILGMSTKGSNTGARLDHLNVGPENIVICISLEFFIHPDPEPGGNTDSCPSSSTR